MNQNQASLTATISAYVRGYHSTYDSPKVFDDFLAYRLFSEEEKATIGHHLSEGISFFDPENAAACPDQSTALRLVMRAMNSATTLSRSRYTEDNLEAAVKQGIQQYVMLGAGLDTFAFRQPHMLKQLQVFEVDHPSTQAAKLQRLNGSGLELPEQLHFVPIDFTKDSLSQVLRDSEYSPQKLSFFSWLGVTYYLTREEALSTLRTIADIAPAGSTIIFDYMDSDALVPERTSKPMQKMQAIALQAGEPMKTGFNPVTLAEGLSSIGLRLHENLSPTDIEERYFAGRSDGYHAFEHINIAQVIVE